jgi:hypothetical protein
VCKSCYAIERRKYYEINKEEILEHRKEYLAKPEVIEQRKEYYDRPEVKKLNKKYRENNREKFLINGYKRNDKKKNLTCDLTVEWMKENITNKTCIYCGETEKLGCDRIDNTKGHTMNNVVPCCADCNYKRGNNFSFTEMLRLSPLLKQFRLEKHI